MAILPLVYYPDKRLGTPTQKVSVFDDALKQTLQNMWNTHYAQKNCAALAANQMGLPWSITVIDFSADKDQPLCLINPVITEKSATTTCTREGCMSIPGNIGSAVTRASEITLTYQTETGEEKTLKADGFLAKCIQHEVDHLNGLTYLDHLSSWRRKILEQKYLKKRQRL